MDTGTAIALVGMAMGMITLFMLKKKADREEVKALKDDIKDLKLELDECTKIKSELTEEKLQLLTKLVQEYKHK